MSMLERILETKRKEIDTIELSPPTTTADKQSLVQAIKNRTRDVALIAEVKKASPSKGLIRKEFDPVTVAQEYEEAGVDAISVLTDRTFFQGDPSFLVQIKKSVDVPVLRKDFILDPIQIGESAAIGADAILLIAAVMEPIKLKELYDCAKGLELDVLLEIHTLNELDKVLSVFTPELIGINNRNLTTFETKLENTVNIARHIPPHIPFVSESGIASKNDLQFVNRAGASAVLVGESLMRSPNIGKAVSSLLGEEL